MPLRSARLTGDPVLENCLDGNFRMLAGQSGLPVFRVQSALIDLGRSVGPAGADGIFGSDTGAAITDYKTEKGLIPNDPVVGPGTTRALDDDLFRDPAFLDPVFAEFSPAVVEHRLEQFVARELTAFLQAPFDSWRHMLAQFALQGLNSGELLGIVAQSRAGDLRDRFLAVADPVQPNGMDPDTFFDDQTIAGDLGRTVIFLAEGELRSLIVLSDPVVLGRGTIRKSSDNTHAPSSLAGVVVHELTHARNANNIAALESTADTDIGVYADVPLALARSAATRIPTARVLHSYVAEITARHVHWVIVQEQAGTPGGIAIRGLTPQQLAAAAVFYFVEVPAIYDANQYGAGINAQGDAMRFPQLDLWLRLCAAQSFSSNLDDDQLSTQAFTAAAQFCADQLVNPSFDFAQDNGVFPLSQDFS